MKTQQNNAEEIKSKKRKEITIELKKGIEQKIGKSRKDKIIYNKTK